MGRADSLVQNASDWDGNKCLTSGLVVPAKGIRACEFQRDVTDTYADSFGAVVDRKAQSVRFFRKDNPCGPWGLELQWTCYFREGEGGESANQEGKGTRSIITERMAQAVAEAKRMVKVGKQALAKPPDRLAFRLQWQKEHYPHAEFEEMIHSGTAEEKLPAFSVATFNLWGFQHWQLRNDNVVKALAERNFSIIGFQEVALPL